MNALTRTPEQAPTRVMLAIWPPFLFRRPFATVLLLLVATAFVAAACSGSSSGPSQEAVMFDEKGRPIAEDEAAAIKAAATVISGDTAPDFGITLFQTALHNAGENLRLSDLKGHPVVVNFWFPSCPPCRAEMPDLEMAFQNHRKDGVEFVAVQLLGLDTAQDGQDFIGEVGVNFAVGADEDDSIFRAYKIRSFPSTVFLDRDLRFVRMWAGPLSEGKLEEFVQELLQ